MPASFFFAVVVVLCIILFPVRCTGNSSVSSSSSNNYQSVRSLNEYGQAVQLQNARAACEKQGRLIVAVCRKRQLPSTTTGLAEDQREGSGKTEIWILSPAIPNVRQHYRRRNQDSDFDDPLISFLSRGSNSVVGIICTGLHADANWITRKLQFYCKSVWERYDTELPILAAAHATAWLKQSFWGYHSDENRYQGPAWSITAQMNEKDLSHWSRPLGIRTMLVSPCDNSDDGGVNPQLLVIEPSGVVVGDYDRFCCIGKDSEAVQLALEESFAAAYDDVDTCTAEDLEQRLLGVLARSSTGTAGNGVGRKSQWLLEILDETGNVKRKRLPY